MKLRTFFVAAAILATIVACGQKKEGSAETRALLPKSAEIDSVSYLIGVNFGSFIKNYNFGEDLNYGQIEKGIKAYLNAKGNPRDSSFAEQFRIDPNEMERLFNSFLAKRREYTTALNKEKEEAFLNANLKKNGVQSTESGLQYTIIEAGNDVKPGPQDTVYVNYKGTLPDGTVFDETPEGSKPIRMQLDRVIKGWTEGLQLIGEGGKIQLVIPSSLAYGENGTRGIEPNTPLTFEVSLAEVKPFVEKEEEAK